ncbi:hypothetical protein FXO38_14487 [Capsicum annuum]|nr:hypothetical protein FXO38_14487 [Capsicum annuum]KAF3669969.1 hypothetical protein FXO37_08762 [Capsicum annuum]
MLLDILVARLIDYLNFVLLENLSSLVGLPEFCASRKPSSLVGWLAKLSPCCVLFILSQHLNTILYYMRNKAKYEPNIVVKFTTTDFVFRNKIDALYHNFVENGKKISAIPEKHEVEEYIRGFYCDANVPWNKVDYVLFSVYVPREKFEFGHWILGVFDFTDWCIYVYDSNRTRRGDKFVQKVMLPYQTLIPYFLKKVNFYLEKDIAKSENDTLPIKMVDELP